MHTSSIRVFLKIRDWFPRGFLIDAKMHLFGSLKGKHRETSVDGYRLCLVFVEGKGDSAILGASPIGRQTQIMRSTLVLTCSRDTYYSAKMEQVWTMQTCQLKV